jgi:hypothetical protein
VLFILVLLSLACNLPTTAATTPTGSSILLTEVAGTLGALQTATSTATVQRDPTLPPDRTATQTPTLSRPANTPTVTVQPCDQAQFIADVTIPDGTKMVPGQAFTKTWRLRNLGSCAWDNRYALVFSSGDALGAPAVVNLPGSVPSGGTVDLSIDMKAPTATGTFVSRWKLRNPAGQVFGVVADQPFFVEIVVVQATLTVTPTRTVTVTPTVTSTQPSTGVIYDFTANLCKAEWRSQAGGPVLTCPGSPGSSDGYVMQMVNPVLETGDVENLPVILTMPRPEAQGVMTGRFPGLAIQAGYHFRATLGCLSGQAGCSVTYQLNYSIGGGAVENLDEWTQTYDGSITGVDVDLSALAGQTVDLVLVVLSGAEAVEDQAVWVYPRIVKE